MKEIVYYLSPTKNAAILKIHIFLTTFNKKNSCTSGTASYPTDEFYLPIKRLTSDWAFYQKTLKISLMKGSNISEHLLHRVSVSWRKSDKSWSPLPGRPGAA